MKLFKGETKEKAIGMVLSEKEFALLYALFRFDFEEILSEEVGNIYSELSSLITRTAGLEVGMSSEELSTLDVDMGAYLDKAINDGLLKL